MYSNVVTAIDKILRSYYVSTISSNKTQLTLFHVKVAYPVYLTIGNIPKDIC